MELDVARFCGPCACGRTHTLKTKTIIIGSKATDKLGDIIGALGLKAGGCIICDSNTKPFADFAAERIGRFLYKAAPVITLEADNLHADEKSVAAIEDALPKDAAWMIAAGSGIIHDITRYTAYKRGIPFISYPTAASVDGFLSTICAMTWHGFKKTLQGVAPIALVADTDVYSQAPYRLIASGISDMLGKYTALADWQCGRLLAGEDFCGRVYSLTKEAADGVKEYLPAIHAGDSDANELLMHALIISGISMQMWGDSRPASGSEHHLSHFWEMGIINEEPEALHGEKVGVGLLIALRHYEKIEKLRDIEGLIRPYEGMPLPLMRKKFGGLYDDILKENQPDLLRSISSEKMVSSFPELKKIIAGLPDARRLRPFMQAAGCVTAPEEIGIDRGIIPESVILSPYVRRRLTIMRASKLLPI